MVFLKFIFTLQHLQHLFQSSKLLLTFRSSKFLQTMSSRPTNGTVAPKIGTCECDCGTFCCSLLCPCVVTGRVAEHVGRDNCTMCCASCLKGGSGCFHACTVGHELRYQNGMEIHLCRNACYTGLCSPCGLAQDYYFVKGQQAKGVSLVQPTAPARQNMQA